MAKWIQRWAVNFRWPRIFWCWIPARLPEQRKPRWAYRVFREGFTRGNRIVLQQHQNSALPEEGPLWRVVSGRRLSKPRCLRAAWLETARVSATILALRTRIIAARIPAGIVALRPLRRGIFRRRSNVSFRQTSFRRDRRSALCPRTAGCRGRGASAFAARFGDFERLARGVQEFGIRRAMQCVRLNGILTAGLAGTEQRLSRGRLRVVCRRC